MNETLHATMQMLVTNYKFSDIISVLQSIATEMDLSCAEPLRTAYEQQLVDEPGEDER